MSDPKALVRVCRKCSVQSVTPGNFCSNCGTSFVRQGLSRRAKIIAPVATVVALVLSGGVAATIVSHRHAEQHAAAAKAASEARAAAKDRRHRHAIVKKLESAITKDARGDYEQGALDGPIKYATCDPLGGGSTDDLTAITTTFTCLVVNQQNDDGTVSGYNYSATINWTKHTYTWQFVD